MYDYIRYILESNLSIFNVGRTPMFTKARREVLDIAFGSQCMAYWVSNKRVQRAVIIRSSNPLLLKSRG